MLLLVLLSVLAALLPKPAPDSCSRIVFRSAFKYFPFNDCNVITRRALIRAMKFGPALWTAAHAQNNSPFDHRPRAGERPYCAQASIGNVLISGVDRLWQNCRPTATATTSNNQWHSANTCNCVGIKRQKRSVFYLQQLANSLIFIGFGTWHRFCGGLLTEFIRSVFMFQKFERN